MAFTSVCAALITAAPVALAAPAPFDLAGPELQVQVTRGSVSLPISEVPGLATGDRVVLKADLPASQSERYLLVLAFLRGSTNPPPPEWLFRCETWTGACARDGLSVTVPDGAQQVLVFLAPKSGGDFKTIVSAVRGRPGAFVRASQDLNQATLDRTRLEEYLSSIRNLNAADPARLKETSLLLARSLAIRVNDKCLDKIPELQAACLTDGQEALILNDGHSTSIVEALTSGAVSDLAMEASFTPQLSYGYYSPYIASVLDIARIFSSFGTAQYQYIPALAALRADRLALTLNTPPSFHNPKSVLVAALPAVQKPQLPPLHAVDPAATYCARKTSLVLPVEGAPLVFSSRYAHDVMLSIAGSDGQRIELPAQADAEQGGFVVDTARLAKTQLGDTIHAALRGFWGFDRFEGPGFQLSNSHAQSWSLADGSAGTLVVGRESSVHLRAASVSCVDSFMLRDPSGKELKAEWKQVRPDEVEVQLPLQNAAPGELTLLVGQYGASTPQKFQLQAFAEAGRLDSLSVHAGDSTAVLHGSRLDQVTALSLQGVQFAPGELTTTTAGDELALAAVESDHTSALRQTDAALAKVSLKDGRILELKTVIGAPRPAAKLIGKSVLPAAASASSKIRLASEDELPQDARLRFSLRAQSPAIFARDAQIEVATADESSTAVLTLANGGITLEDAKVAVATLDPAKALGGSAFGPLKFRMSIKGTSGDWQPLVTLVRLPVLEQLTCPATPDLACKLTGANLFLVDSVAGEPDFDHAAAVPSGFPGYAIPVPHPSDGTLYVKLRDNPAVINTAELDAQVLPPTPQDPARAAARNATADRDSPSPSAVPLLPNHSP